MLYFQPLNAHFQAPINNPKLVLMRTSQSVCNLNETTRVAQYELIIIVKSSPGNEARRCRLRRLISHQVTKLATSVGLLFSLGIPADTRNRSELLDTISDEAARFDDIILADFTDTYYNLTLKTLLNLRYAHVACHGASPLFAFMDDDHGLNLTAPKVIRKPGHKWAVSREDMPFFMYPDYAAGPCYFLGSEALESLSIAAAFTKPFSMEDAYVGLIAAKLGIKMHQLPGVHLHGHI
ncbi:unnamed protein product [Schistocephalus solidus]|uniref:Hexosyltransferase n=1 Tax=Schistocephalus solidus TaxID=70667 RepID=A0A183SNU5_SCHSO|nr:unnamed protein product [Schistocephalus solidus]